ncbi:phospholipase D-like domain-containing protein [Halomonas sp. hl-4]|uniref:phospholipase D-like domain-containing protein n=1 Tax=Halomonas sp. hl-4 TaxID=1761789 RepID=UPI000BB96F3A|nr:phospholipase D-like domain-containing protein [Halomonas sp. hl-4]SNY96871.1 PLD-like domain-containing protein [Halomonas sp. hl-4]
MKISEATRTYFAKDVYSIWKSRVSKAEESITVYSPYFDRLLISLLGNSQLGNENITIVTELNPASLLEMPNQLRALKNALSNGIIVLSTPRLHAKVLLTDDKFVAIGSQNFTSYARKSKECTVIPAATMTGSSFVDTLIRWREDATSVDENFVDMLLSKISRHIRRHKKLLEETEAEFDELFKNHEEEKQNALLRRLEELERQSHIRMSQGVVYASIEHISGEWDYYDSLIADHEYDLTRWVVKKPGGNTEPYRFSRLAMYPMIIAETGRMGFARIGKTRITYIRKSLNWSNRRLQVGDYSLGVSITFPVTDTKKRNIVVRLTHPYLGSCEAAFLFTGDAFRLIRKHYFKGNSYWNEQHEAFVKELDSGFFGDLDSIASFFRRFFTSFTYKELGLDNKNVRDYLKGLHFRLTVIQFQGNPVLVIKKQW